MTFDHSQQAAGRVYYQFRSAPKLKAWIDTLPALAQVELENPAQKIADILDIPTASGDQLDIIGRIVGAARPLEFVSTGSAEANFESDATAPQFESDSAPNVVPLVNAGFETGDLTGWTTGSPVFVAQTDPFQGAHHAVLDRGEVISKVFTDIANDNEPIEWRMWFKEATGNEPNNQGYVDILFEGPGVFEIIDLPRFNPGDAPDWTELVTAGTVPPGTNRITVTARHLSINAGDGAWWIDEASMTLGTASGAGAEVPQFSLVETDLAPISNAKFRPLIRAKIAQNNSPATIDDVVRSLRTITQIDEITVNDNLDMTFSVTFGSNLTSDLRDLLNNFDILPRPQGVEFLGFIESASFSQFGAALASFGDERAQFNSVF